MKRTKMILAALVIPFIAMSGCKTLEDALNVTLGSLEVKKGSTTLKVAFSDKDRQAIKNYYAGNRQGKNKKTPPGLAKKGGLSKGHKKRLEKGKGLPPGLEGRVLADSLERKLSALPDGYVRLKIGTDLIIKNIKTNVAVDILYDID
jgi:hypothetical protein